MPASLKVVGHALDGLVKLALNATCGRIQLRGKRFSPVWVFWLCIVLHEAKHSAQESLDAFYAGILPVQVTVGGSGEQAVETGGVGAVAGDHVVRADYVAETFRHFGAVFDDHALREEALYRLVVGDETHVAHELGPEARVDEVQDGMLDAANVLVDGEPILRGP